RDLSEVHEEACKMEHSIADETADKIAKFLKQPKTCPHGHPVPDEDSDIEEDNLLKLSECEKGQEYEVVTVPEDREDVERLLPLGILPGAEIKLVEDPSFSALIIEKGDDRVTLSEGIASKTLVRPCERRRRRHRGRSGR
ncbi:MAG: metal-dependent transcriptional regulator, partial [Candidatus Aenigmatarchaeota archaeon]